MLHRARQLLVRQRTMLSNALRGHLAELGIVSAKGRNGTGELLRIIADGADSAAFSMCWRTSIGRLVPRSYPSTRAS
jgi:transposase